MTELELKEWEVSDKMIGQIVEDGFEGSREINFWDYIWRTLH